MPDPQSAPRRLAVDTALVVLALAAIGWIDYVTGPDIAFSLFYLLPVAAAAWWLHPATAWIAAMAAVVVWSLADAALTPVDRFPFQMLNAATRATVLGGTVLALGSVRRGRQRERSQALDALRASESRFRGLVESTSDLVWEVDEQGRYTYCSPQALDVLGYAPSELVGRRPFDLMPGDEGAHHREIFAELARDPKPLVRLENVNLHRSGRQVVLETSATPIFDASGTFHGLRGIDRDITERKQAEQELLRVLGQLNQAQRLEAIGRLAGGIAHDFNNLLTVILGSADYLLTLVPPGDLAHTEARAIFEAGKRGANLTQQLLTFGRRQVRQSRPIDLNRVLAGMRELLHRLIGEHLRLEILPASEPVRIIADPAQIEQVIANLAANARDAMPNGGTLTISTGHIELDRRTASERQLEPGPYAVLSVKDTGTGIAPDVQPHLFEPFFTTKGRASGTGLGLATVHAIIEQSGGHVDVRTELGAGSLFEILLPRTSDIAEQVPPPRAAAARAQGTETVLVAEDEKAIRDLLVRYLRESGYAVVDSTTPAEAYRLAADGRTIDLLVTDVIMPGMSGPELARRLVALRPSLKVLYVSGYPDGVLAHHGVVAPGIELLQKPFSREALIRKVRAMLDAKDSVVRT